MPHRVEMHHLAFFLQELEPKSVPDLLRLLVEVSHSADDLKYCALFNEVRNQRLHSLGFFLFFYHGNERRQSTIAI